MAAGAHIASDRQAGGQEQAVRTEHRAPPATPTNKSDRPQLRPRSRRQRMGSRRQGTVSSQRFQSRRGAAAASIAAVDPPTKRRAALPRSHPDGHALARTRDIMDRGTASGFPAPVVCRSGDNHPCGECCGHARQKAGESADDKGAADGSGLSILPPGFRQITRGKAMLAVTRPGGRSDRAANSAYCRTCGTAAC